MTALAFALYFGGIGFIAWVGWRRTRSVADYLIGGRRVQPWIAALSAGASDMSGWLLLGLPGLAVVAPTAALWMAAGLLVGTWCNWRYVAAPLRTLSARTEALTLPQLFACAFPCHATLLRTLTALSIVVFFLVYTTAGFVAGGKLFNSVFGVPYTAAVIIGAAVILLYTLFGGFLAVTWTDAVQALMMAAALALAAAFLWTAHDGFELAAATHTAAHGSVVAMLSSLAWGLGYMGQPHILARFMALDRAAGARPARRLAVGWTGFSLAAAIAVGIGGGALVGDGDPERVFILAVDRLFHPLVAGACLAAILAAIMSTADSQLLVTSAALAEDLLPMFAPRGNGGARLRNGRVAVVLVCALAAWLALDPAAGVLALVAHAWAGFGATIGPLLLVLLYDPRASGAGALSGLLAGAATVTLWPQLPQAGYGVYELLPAFVLALAANLVVNRLVPTLTPREG